jgi:glycosyltransferase involved in cell wall biosynthesis
MKGKDIIITGLQPWDVEIGSNCKNIALEFAKNNRVLYVNAPLDRLTAIREKNDPKTIKRKKVLKGEIPDLTQIQENLWELNPRTMLESISRLGIDWLFDVLNKINNKRLAKQISSAIDRLKFKNIILFNDSDMFRSFYLKKLLPIDFEIYYTRDNLIAVDFWKKQGIRIEAEYMRKADLVCGNSTYLTSLAKKFNKNSFYVGQGCDLTIFDENLINEIPDDIKNIKKPIIGYIGALVALRLDIEIIEYLAKQKPEWSIVLVGPEDEAFKKSILHEYKNVHFLGGKNPNELPSYLYAFDVAINPQIVNEVTIGNYPRKIDEYLAMGKPTVATKTEAMSVFADYTYLAENKEEYLQMIEIALKDNSSEKKQKMIEFARSHSWENSVNEIYKAIETVKNNKNGY